MPVNKNALLRYKIIDRCLRNRHRRWTIEDLVDEIEVYDQKYYKYADPNYSITELPLTAEDFNLITKAVKMLETTEDKPEFQQMGRILTRVKKRLTAILNYG